MKKNLLNELIRLSREEYPTAEYGFLNAAVYSIPLSASEQQQYLQLLSFARGIQDQNPLYETLYHELLHLFVLNGSRINLLKSMDRRLRGLAEGQGALVLISGVSGIGKTSLVMAFQDRIQQLGAEFIRIHCFEQESSSYALWHSVVRSTVSLTGISAETLSAPLGQGSEAHSLQQLRQSLAEWLDNAATIKPLVILVDDLHWADEDSLEVLDYLTSQTVQAPILYLATFRSEETQNRQPLALYLPRLQRNRQFDLVYVNPLTQHDVERLVAAALGTHSPQFAKYLLERAEGHPLFTVELLNDLIEQDLLRRNGDGSVAAPEKSMPVPTFLVQLITQRVSRLGSQVERLLAIGAVAGESWQLKIVERLVDMPEAELLEALESALRAEILLVEDNEAEVYRFSHGLIRQVLYSGQLARRRKRLHEQIALQFEQQEAENYYAIAYHYYEAENWEKAVPYCLTAGDEAAKRLANHSALQWYQQASNAAQCAGIDFEAAHITIYERLGRAHLLLEQRQEAEVAFSRMRDVSQHNADLISEGHALVHLAIVRNALHQYDLAEKTAYEALKIGEQSGDPRLITRAHVCLYRILVIRGHIRYSVEQFNEMKSGAEAIEDFVSLSDLFRQRAYTAIWAGEYQLAESFAQQALENARKTEDSLLVVGGYQILSYAQIEAGKYPAAFDNINTILEMSETSDRYHHQVPRLLNQMGYLHLELGDAQDALEWDQKALKASRTTVTQSNYEMYRYSLLNIASDYLQLGKLDMAKETIRQIETIKEAVEYARFRYFNRYLLLLSELSLAQQAYQQSIELAHEAGALAQAHGVRKNLARSHWLEGLALAGMLYYNEAKHHLGLAVKLVDEIQHGSLRWKIRLSLAEVCKKSGESPIQEIQQARQLFDQTATSLSGTHLQEILLSSHWMKQIIDLERLPMPGKLTYPAGLTEREVEVLGWVARGATNQQVAEALHISVRTVNTHMTNILNKTGCENRTAASSFAIQHRLVSR
jgi:predicted ATPase/DNA-binding CsgD family transcriptional regulator